MRRRAQPRNLHPLVAAMALATAVPCASAQVQQPTPPQLAPPAASPSAPRERIVPLEVIVNGSPGGSWALLERDGAMYAPAEAFDEWRLQHKAGEVPLTARGQTWYRLDSIPGFSANMNLANQSVDLVFSATAFAQTRVHEETAAERTKAVPAEPALFLNFDTNLSYTSRRASATERDLGVLGEVGFANNWGVLTTSFVARQLQGTGVDGGPSFRRLESTFTRDLPERGLTLRAGDATTRTGLTGRPTYFGGLQIGRNFGLTPGFVTQPIPVIAGTSAAPSTVELYVNDALRQTSKVPTGPFVIDNFALLAGAGQARVVVRDVLGRETVITQPFFTHSAMLEEGLTDWSAEVGRVRRNLGNDDDSYGQAFTSALWRHGFSKSFTFEVQGQLGRRTRDFSMGVLHQLPFQTLGMAAWSVSRDDVRGSGRSWLIGIENTSLRHGVSLHMQGSSRGYAELGSDPGTLPTRREVAANYTYSDEKFGSIGVGYARLDSYDRGPIQTYSLNYSTRLFEKSSLAVNLTHVNGAESGTSFAMNLTIPLDNQAIVSAAMAHRSGKTDAYVTASKGLAADTGLGWRVLGGARDSTAYSEGGVYYQGARGLVTADASASREQQALRLGAQGALVFMDGSLYAARKLENSFALVEVPGYANVGIGVHGRLLTRTDSDGRALVPRLLPYQANSIRLDPTELPINAELDSIEQIVVPPGRSGVKVVFPVRSGRGALIKILLDDGEAAPPGAEIELVGDKQEFFVARRGEAFVTGLQAKNTLKLKWNGATCSIPVELPDGKIDEIARVGPLTCKGVKR